MKILHVCKKYPHAMGGDAIVVSHLQKQQQAAGHNVVVVTSNCAEIANGTGVYKIGLKDTPKRLDAITCRRIASLMLLLVGMFGILRREQPDVIHTHSVDMAFFVSFAARWHRVPVVHTFHIVTFYDAQQSILRRKSELWLARNANLAKITVPNVYDVRKLQANGLKQAVLLPNGVDVAFWKRGTARQQNNLFTFLAVGRLEAQKGYKYLVKAASLLADGQSQPFAVVIVGDGSQKAALQQQIRALRLDHIISLIGPKTQRQIRALYAKADAAVFCSLYETTPLTLLEAWAAAMPTIATPVGILHHAPRRFGAALVVPPQNAQKLAVAMRRFMRNNALRTAIAAQGNAQTKQYDWPIVSKQAEAIYRSTQ